MKISARHINKHTRTRKAHSQKFSPSEQTLIKQFQGYLNNIDGKRILVASNSKNVAWETGGSVKIQL